MSEPTAAEAPLDPAPAEALLDRIAASPTAFHAVRTVRAELDAAGFAHLPEGAVWDVRPGGRYYTTRNGSSLVAWRVGAGAASRPRFQIAAAHADSPAFKLKAEPEVEGPDGALLLETEAYGGMIDYTWFDRPLALAGRVLARAGSRIESRLVGPVRDVAIFPSVAVHLNREVNRGFAPDRKTDLRALVSTGDLRPGSFRRLLAGELGCAPDDVLAHDLFLVNADRGRVWGTAGEFVSAPRLDDLMCAFTALDGFLSAGEPHGIAVYALFDNEEVGSGTKQGALSTFLADTLARASAALGLDAEGYRRALAASMLVSCDNAHAGHPNRPELSDAAMRPRLNGGVVVKEAANQRYCTDAFSRAVFLAVLDRAGVPHQSFANRSDTAGGSTLGNLSNTQVSVHAVDVGLPQLAMHSAYETAGARDVAAGAAAIRAFFDADLRIDGADAVELG